MKGGTKEGGRGGKEGRREGERDGWGEGGREGGRAYLGVDDGLAVVGHETDERGVPLVGDLGEGGGA